jgi:hypothetical protein
MIIIQTRFPRSKKKRIRKKWQKRYGTVIIPQTHILPCRGRTSGFIGHYLTQICEAFEQASKEVAQVIQDLGARLAASPPRLITCRLQIEGKDNGTT